MRIMKIGRNDTCPCGSKKKYKRCCMLNKEAANYRDSQHQSVPDTDESITRKPQKQRTKFQNNMNLIQLYLMLFIGFILGWTIFSIVLIGCAIEKFIRRISRTIKKI